ncbi:hypothetical protein [Ornithinimicrobium kibberense]|uniref:hypothetical protein n=1 Tax=Ornithinimicrobium kibberense TaxID=282060 RepID=UPI003611A174
MRARAAAANEASRGQTNRHAGEAPARTAPGAAPCGPVRVCRSRSAARAMSPCGWSGGGSRPSARCAWSPAARAASRVTSSQRSSGAPVRGSHSPAPAPTGTATRAPRTSRTTPSWCSGSWRWASCQARAPPPPRSRASPAETSRRRLLTRAVGPRAGGRPAPRRPAG